LFKHLLAHSKQVQGPSSPSDLNKGLTGFFLLATELIKLFFLVEVSLEVDGVSLDDEEACGSTVKDCCFHNKR